MLNEWLRAPRLDAELEAQEALFPRGEVLPFGSAEASRAAALYGSVSRPKGREIDLAVAAHALERDAGLWTLDPSDFEDIAGLRLV